MPHCSGVLPACTAHRAPSDRRGGVLPRKWQHGYVVSRWTCPNCEREFGRTNQSHVCLPGNTVDESFEGRPPVQREIYELLMAHLSTLGPVHVDAVRVGLFLKSARKFAEVRPRARSLSLWLG